MKLLVSTKETQGLRADDCCFVPDGEIVVLGLSEELFADMENLLIGVDSKTATSTAKVANVKITFEQLRLKLVDHWAEFEGGKHWAEAGRRNTNTCKVIAQNLQRIGAHFPLGAIVEKKWKRGTSDPVFRMRSKGKRQK